MRRKPADAAEGRRSVRRRISREVATLVCVLCAVCAGLVLPLAVRPANAQALAKGLSDTRLNGTVSDQAFVDAAVKELGHGALGARYTVVMVDWSTVQPSAPPAAYNETYFANLTTSSPGFAPRA